MTRIKGIHGDERYKLRPDVTVNVYEINLFEECEWIESYQVSDLDDDWLNYYNEEQDGEFEWSDFGLEPCDECGDPIKMIDAYTDEYINQIKL
ncbi:hypothetical protein CAL7716_107740 (plasmid) [Calothrix sp. PCC 7716]|nr:hypothetical protein CAL7716_107740 [Calothrix sp. PCC 7716]